MNINWIILTDFGMVSPWLFTTNRTTTLRHGRWRTVRAEMQKKLYEFSSIKQSIQTNDAWKLTSPHQPHRSDLNPPRTNSDRLVCDHNIF